MLGAAIHGISSLLFASSSLLTRATYLGFYVDLLIEAIALSSGLLTATITASVYIGLLLYMHATIDDMRARLSSIGTFEPQQSPGQNRQRTDNQRMWSIYAEEIDFHFDIIG